MFKAIPLVFGHLATFIVITQLLTDQFSCEPCQATKRVYDKNSIIDQLISCTISKSSDIDLTSTGDLIKLTPKSLVEQGLADKTSISYARLSGIWTARRPPFIDSGWLCETNTTTVTSAIELSGLALNVIERMDVPSNRNQHVLAAHKPCKTFDLPTSFCRQTKPIYRVIKTWVDKAYFNLTLSQSRLSKKPVIDKLFPIFTCPGRFSQRISHSPSAVYLLSKLAKDIGEPGIYSSDYLRTVTEPDSPLVNPITHPISFASTGDDKSSSYPSSPRFIMSKATQSLQLSLEECIESMDSDLESMVDHTSFKSEQSKMMTDKTIIDSFAAACSDNDRLSEKMDIAKQHQMYEFNSFIEDKRNQTQSTSHTRRSQTMPNKSVGPDQLLDPYGYYSLDEDVMINDN